MSVLTLDELFFARSAKAPGKVLEKGVDPGDEVMAALQSDIKKNLPRLPWKSVEKEMAAKIGEVLNVGIDDVLVGAWTKTQALRKYADPAAHPPDEVILVPLAPHKVKSAHSPHVDLVIKDSVIGSLVLDVRLSLELEGVVLKIQAGRIRDVRAGTCRAAGGLRLSLASRVGSKEIASFERKTPKLQLGGALRLGDGIPLQLPGNPPPEPPTPTTD